MKPKSKYLILIIDDNSDNLQLLCDVLDGYRKAVTTDGLDGIDRAEKLSPDLILLDIMMPELDGYEVCRRIKSNPKTIDIPIIFLSGRRELEDIIKGFKIGAVDYITKPFEQEELLARVKTHLELKHSKELIHAQNQQLKHLNTEKNNFLSIATHDLKNPLKVIQGFSRLMQDYNGKFTKEESYEMIGDIATSADMMLHIINNLELITKLEEKNIKPLVENFNVNYLLDHTISFYKDKAGKKKLNIRIINKLKTELVKQDSSLIKECLSNLVSNSIKFSPPEKEIIIRAYNESLNPKMEQLMIFEVEDEGPGIKKEEMPRLFSKFGRLSAETGKNEIKTGLGLAITKMISSLLNGSVSCESYNGNGTKFTLRFPVYFNG